MYEGYSREHMWPKSHGDLGTTMGPGTDFHHLRPADQPANSFRNNMNYCNANGPHTRSGGCYEPPKSSKGDCARSSFYMATRWKTEYFLYLDNLELTNNQPRLGKLDDLLEWHVLDPVDGYEIHRMNMAYDQQHNRNPYIDHPELVEYIWGSRVGQPWDGGVTLHTSCFCKGN